MNVHKCGWLFAFVDIIKLFIMRKICWAFKQETVLPAFTYQPVFSTVKWFSVWHFRKIKSYKLFVLWATGSINCCGDRPTSWDHWCMSLLLFGVLSSRRSAILDFPNRLLCIVFHETQIEWVISAMKMRITYHSSRVHVGLFLLLDCNRRSRAFLKLVPRYENGSRKLTNCPTSLQCFPSILLI